MPYMEKLILTRRVVSVYPRIVVAKGHRGSRVREVSPSGARIPANLILPQRPRDGRCGNGSEMTRLGSDFPENIKLELEAKGLTQRIRESDPLTNYRKRSVRALL
jgi:hypothetical protein